MLVPVRVEYGPGLETQVAESLETLGRADPFSPIMTTNGAELVQEYTSAHPEKRLGTVMRACEVRTIQEMVKRGDVAPGSLFLIGVDCLGTFPVEETDWRPGLDKLMIETLQFARQGGVAGYRYRTSCQICADPSPQGIDLAIKLLGLPARRVLIVSTEKPETGEELGLDEITHGAAPFDLMIQHDEMHAALIRRHARTRERTIEALNDSLALDLDELITHLETCEACRACLEACALFAGSSPFESDGVTINRDAAIRWVVSCAGCGICEQNCPNHLPLVVILARIQKHLQSETT